MGSEEMRPSTVGSVGFGSAGEVLEVMVFVPRIPMAFLALVAA